MRIVLDTNLLVSGLIYGGLPRQLINPAQAGTFDLCTSEVLLAELLEVLGRAKFADRLRQAGLSPVNHCESRGSCNHANASLQDPVVLSQTGRVHWTRWGTEGFWGCQRSQWPTAARRAGLDPDG